MDDLIPTQQFPRTGVRKRVGETIGAGEERRHEPVWRVHDPPDRVSTERMLVAERPLDQVPATGEIHKKRPAAVIEIGRNRDLDPRGRHRPEKA